MTLDEVTVAERLLAMGDVTRLGLSLLEARAPMLDDAQLTALGLQLAAQVDLPALPPEERAFVGGASGKLHLVGDEFSACFSEGRPTEFVPLRAILVGVRLPDGSRPDWLSPGQSGLLTVQFPQEPPALPPFPCRLGVASLLRLRKP